MSTYFSEYIRLILTVGICAFICEYATSLGKSKKMSMVFGLISSLCIFLTVISPLTTLSGSFATFKQRYNNIGSSTEAISDEAFYSLVEENLKEEIKQEIIKKTGISDECISIDLSVDKENGTIKEISVKHTDKRISNQEITDILTKKTGDETNIIFTE